MTMQYMLPNPFQNAGERKRYQGYAAPGRAVPHSSEETRSMLVSENGNNAADDLERGVKTTATLQMPTPEYEGKPLYNRYQLKLGLMRLGTFDTYAVCAALLTGFCSNTEYLQFENVCKTGDSALRCLMVSFQQLLIRVCTVTGLYSMLIFILCSMYTRTALARPILGYRLFQRMLDRTANQRKAAFYSMYYTSILFALAIVTSCFYSMSDLIATFAALSIFAVIGLMALHSWQIMQEAGIVFADDATVLKALNEDDARKGMLSQMQRAPPESDVEDE